MSLPGRRHFEALSAVPRHRAYIGMGGNLGNVCRQLRSALQGMAALPATSVAAVSSLYRTKPVDAGGPDYLNTVAALDCALGPQELLRALLHLEAVHDRERPFHHAPRTLDLDLLWYGGARLDTPALTLPHPRMHERAFVLVPLRELRQALDAAHEAAEWPPLPDDAECDRLAARQGIEKWLETGWVDRFDLDNQPDLPAGRARPD